MCTRAIFRVGSHSYALVRISVVGAIGADKRVVLRFLKPTTSVRVFAGHTAAALL